MPWLTSIELVLLHTSWVHTFIVVHNTILVAVIFLATNCYMCIVSPCSRLIIKLVLVGNLSFSSLNSLISYPLVWFAKSSCHFLAFDFCRFCMVIRFFIPATTANDLRLRRIIYPRFYQLHFFSYLNSWERASIFLFECSVLNKGTAWYHFITSLVWRGPWLGIEPGTSRTRSQHYTTRLSRRRYLSLIITQFKNWLLLVFNVNPRVAVLYVCCQLALGYGT